MDNQARALPLTDKGLVRLLGHLPDALVLCDAAGRILGSNTAAATLFDALPPMPTHATQLVPEIEEWGPEGLWTMAEAGELDAVFEYPTEATEGEPRLYISIRTSTTRNGASEPRVLLSLHDISEERKLQARLRDLSMTDELTGIPNRRFLSSTLAFEEERARRFNRTLFVMFLDLDSFKMINDLYGHAVGDQAISHFATILSNNIRRIDTVCRWGGDEFVVVGLCTSADGALTLLNRILKAVDANPLELGDEILTIRASIGMALAHYDSESRPNYGEKLLEEADALMLKVKEREGIQYLVGILGGESAGEVAL